MSTLLKQNRRVEDITREIREHLYQITSHSTATNKHRLAAGQKLLALEMWVDDLKAYHKEHLSDLRSWTDCRKCMNLARSDNPDAALEAEREARRQHMANLRASRAHSGRSEEIQEVSDKVVNFPVSDTPNKRGPDAIVLEALAIVFERMTSQQRSVFHALYMRRIEK
jgi:hypothetical protein